MKWNLLGHWVTLFSLIFLLVLFAGGCGSSTDGDPIVCPGDPRCEDSPDDSTNSISDLVGTYNLSGFTIRDETDNSSVDETDAESWCGRLVINSQGEAFFDEVIDGQLIQIVWDILEVTNDNMNIRESDNCEVWADYLLDGDNFSILWPEGQCLRQGVSMDLHFVKAGSSEVYPPADECSYLPNSDDDDEDGEDIDSMVPDLVGTYEMVRYTMENPETGRITEGLETDDTWSGRMIITDQNVMNMSLSVGENRYRTVWMIDEAIDSDGDGINDRLFVDDGSCESIAVYTYDAQQNILGLLFPANECSEVEMFFIFLKTSDTVAALNSNPENGINALVSYHSRGQITGMPKLSRAIGGLTEKDAE